MAAPTVEEYLAPYPVEIRALAAKLRGHLRAVVPEVREAVYPGWQLIGYRAPDGKKSRYFAFLAPFEDRLVLGFEWGVRMEDPAGILSGKGRQVRQIEIEPGSPPEDAVLLDYIQRALEAAGVPGVGPSLRPRRP